MFSRVKTGKHISELIRKSREAALASVNIFNSSLIGFKAELFIVTMVIAWTYLLHGYFRQKNINYRIERKFGRRKYDRNRDGSYRFWDLGACLKSSHCPIDSNTAFNLRFLIGIRHEIEHRMTGNIDAGISAKLQACVLNYNYYLVDLFGEHLDMSSILPLTIQFGSLAPSSIINHKEKSLPGSVATFIADFENALPDDSYRSSKYALRLKFEAVLANTKGTADQVITFVNTDGAIPSDNQIFFKDREKPKYLPSQIVQAAKNEGFTAFSLHQHMMLWKKLKAKDSSLGFGVKVGTTWYWYDKWLQEVLTYCRTNHTAED